MKQAESILRELTHAEYALMDAEVEQRQHKVWFWRFKEDARRRVRATQPAVDAARVRVEEVRARKEKALREAKAVLGLFSEAGVAEGREVFWESFASGKVFAQRQSFVDAFFALLDRRERDWLGLFLQLLFQTLLNFVAGLTVSVFVFVGRLPALIWSFSPSFWSGLAFFLLASVSALSVVAAYLGLLVGAGGAVGYSAYSLAVQRAERLEWQQQQRQRISYREHDD